MKRYLTEAIGTFFLVLTVGLAVNQGVALAALAIGSSLMVMVYAGGHISGAHYNPAVTLAVWMRGGLSAKEVGPYWAAQFVGGICAALLIAMFTGRVLHVAPGDQATLHAALLGEILYSFALCYVVLNVATAKETEGNSYFGLAIGFTVVVGALAMGGISGGAFNPAVGLSPALVELITGGAPSAMVWIYAVGPLLGAALSAWVYRIQHR